MARTKQQYYADNVGIKKDGREFYLNDELLAKLENVPSVIDNVTSTSATDALSANMGRVLQDQINQLASVGTFLSLWDCTTGLPETDPAVNPYQYKTGDYYIVSKIAEEGEDNYRPRGTQYDVGIASTVVETEDIQVGDWYLYDGGKWIKQDNTGKEYPIDDALSLTSRNAVENRVVTEALNKLDNLKVLPMPHEGDELDGIIEFIMGGGRVVYYKEGENNDIYFYEVVRCDGWMITAYCHENYEVYELETDAGETYDAISNATLRPVLYNDYIPGELTAAISQNTIRRLTTRIDVTSTSTQDTYNLRLNAPLGTLHVVKLNSTKGSDVTFIPTDGLTNPYGFDLTLKAGGQKTLLVVGTSRSDETKGEIIYATDQVTGGDINMKVFPLPQAGDDLTEVEAWVREGNAVTFLEDLGEGEQYFRDVYYSDLSSGLLFTETNEGFYKVIEFDTDSMEVTDVINAPDRPIKYDDLYWDGPNSSTTLSGKFGSKRFYNKNTTLTAGTSTRYPTALYIAEIRNSHTTNNITVSLGAGILNPYNISVELKPGEKKHLLLVGEEDKRLTAIHLMGPEEENNVLVVEEPNLGDDIAEILEAIRGGKQVIFYVENQEDGSIRFSPVDTIYEEDAYFDTYDAVSYKVYAFNGTEVIDKSVFPNPFIKRTDYGTNWFAGFGRYNVVTDNYTLDFPNETSVEYGMIYIATVYNNANNPITVSFGNKIRNPEGATVKIDSKKEATMFFRGYNGQLTYLCAVNGENTNNIYSIPEVGDDISDMIAKVRDNKRVILIGDLEGNLGTQIYYLDSVDDENLFLNFYKLSGGGWMIEFDNNGEVVDSAAIADGNMKYDDYRVRQREGINS